MKEKIAIWAIVANIVLAVSKLGIGWWIGAGSIMAEGWHSLTDVFSSFISFVGIEIAKKPKDDKYPYGYFKYEVLAGLIIVVILFATGSGIVYDGWVNIFDNQALQVNYWGLGVMFVSALINETMARLKIYYGKKENSVALISDGVHSRVDVYSSLIILVGLIFVPYWQYMDSALTILVGLYVIYESYKLARESLGSLTDKSAGKEVEEKVKAVLQKNNIKYSEVITQQKGAVVSANITINIEKEKSVAEATQISDFLKTVLLNEVEELEYVVIQIEDREEIFNYFQSNNIFEDKKVVKWEGRRFLNRGKNDKDLGFCECEKCGDVQKHLAGVPCQSVKCNKCGTTMHRKL
jgi:cation diffusion facilitator family transporter